MEKQECHPRRTGRWLPAANDRNALALLNGQLGGSADNVR
jgi:hypothetical protein